MADLELELKLQELAHRNEVRALKFRIKNVNKVMGRQGQTIYEQRCKIAELHEMLGKENRGYYRRLETMVAARDEELKVLRGEIDRLREKLSQEKESESTTHC